MSYIEIAVWDVLGDMLYFIVIIGGFLCHRGGLI